MLQYLNNNNFTVCYFQHFHWRYWCYKPGSTCLWGPAWAGVATFCCLSDGWWSTNCRQRKFLLLFLLLYHTVSPPLIKEGQTHPLFLWLTAPKSDLPLPRRVMHRLAVAELRKSLSWWWLWATMSHIPYIPRVSQQTLHSEFYKCKDNLELLWCTPKDRHCPCIKFLGDKTKLSSQLWCQGKKICGSLKEEREGSRFSGTLLTSFF